MFNFSTQHEADNELQHCPSRPNTPIQSENNYAVQLCSLWQPMMGAVWSAGSAPLVVMLHIDSCAFWWCELPSLTVVQYQAYVFVHLVKLPPPFVHLVNLLFIFYLLETVRLRVT